MVHGMTSHLHRFHHQGLQHRVRSNERSEWVTRREEDPTCWKVILLYIHGPYRVSGTTHAGGRWDGRPRVRLGMSRAVGDPYPWCCTRPQSISLLLGEGGQFGLHVRPCLPALDDARDGGANRFLVRSDLLHAIPIAEGECVVFDRLEIHRDAKRRPQFVVS